MAELRTGDGRALPPLLQAELDRLRRRLVLTLELEPNARQQWRRRRKLRRLTTQ